jgi:O-antigen ligase
MNNLGKAIEACWLGTATLVPMAMVPESLAIGFIEGPKVFVLRSFALLLLVLLSVEWARQPLVASAAGTGINVAKVQRSLGNTLSLLRRQPIAMAAAAVTTVTILSTVLSPVTNVSVFGVDPGRDSYGLFSIASYLIVFVAVATHLRTGVQIRRLIWVVTISSTMLGIYGIQQHFGVDFMLSSPLPQSRVSLTFGNPVFAGSYLLMTIPLTLALWQAWRTKYSALTHVGIGTVLIAIPITALAFTLSRGAAVSLVVAFAVLLGSMALSMGARAIVRPGASVLLAVVIAFAMGYVPVPGMASGALADRLSTISHELTPDGGLSARYSIWSTAAEAYLAVPWIDTSAYPEIPSLGLAPLRPLIGYGPDMFRYAFAQESNPADATIPWHGHNFIVHTAIELGLLGVFAYAALAITTGLALVRMWLATKRGEVSPWMSVIVFALMGIFAGRLLEQMAGKPQVSDLTQGWLMAGVVLAMVRMPASEWLAPIGKPNQITAPRAADSRRSPGGARQAAARDRRSKAPAVMCVQHSIRVAMVTLLGLVTLVFWWQAVLMSVNSTFIARRAISAGDSRHYTKESELLLQAIHRSPSSWYPRKVLANSLLAQSRLDANNQQRIGHLLEARMISQGALDRNPLDYRAWSLRSEVMHDLISLDAGYAVEAVETHAVTAALTPGLRRPAENLAKIYLAVEDYESALAVVSSARNLATNTDPEGYFLSFLEALALQGLGRPDEAYTIALMLSQTSGLQDLGLTAEADAIATALSLSGRTGAPTLEEAIEGRPR